MQESNNEIASSKDKNARQKISDLVDLKLVISNRRLIDDGQKKGSFIFCIIKSLTCVN